MSWLFYMYYSSACFWVLHSTFSITVYCRLLEAGRYRPPRTPLPLVKLTQSVAQTRSLFLRHFYVELSSTNISWTTSSRGVCTTESSQDNCWLRSFWSAACQCLMLFMLMSAYWTDSNSVSRDKIFTASYLSLINNSWETVCKWHLANEIEMFDVTLNNTTIRYYDMVLGLGIEGTWSLVFQLRGQSLSFCPLETSRW